ncbi:Shedu anti-phage system protein SduA domain-containing protein [Pseudobacillus sp. 179-B 2D1 NHS]|uniref:Shedu anti-phage system protein SduA domain-containing protein n=1 Tax=Pseudobacillus sp. 179-B 2D1 NHS TaxID=3374292 RepID=UPI0038796EE1
MDTTFMQGEIVICEVPYEEGDKPVRVRPAVVLVDSGDLCQDIQLVPITSRIRDVEDRQIYTGLHVPSQFVYKNTITVKKAHIRIRKIGKRLTDNELYYFAREYSWYMFPFLRRDVIYKLGEAIKSFEELLTHSADEVEENFHNFLINNPVLIDPYGTVHNKPVFNYPAGKSSSTGKTKVIPDFIVSYSVQHYRLIEIERPNKELVTKEGPQRATTTQAVYQLTEWEEFIESHHDIVEPDFPGINRSPNRSYTLIIGRSEKLGNYSDIDKLRTHLKRTNNCEVLTYDDLLQRAKDLKCNLEKM